MSLCDLSLDDLDLVTGGTAQVLRRESLGGVSSLGIEMSGPYSLSQANRAAIDLANEELRGNPDLRRVDLEFQYQDRHGVDYVGRGGWTREDMERPDDGSLGGERWQQGDFDHRVVGSSGTALADAGDGSTYGANIHQASYNEFATGNEYAPPYQSADTNYGTTTDPAVPPVTQPPYEPDASYDTSGADVDAGPVD